MIRFIKTGLLMVVLIGTTVSAFADRGVGKKAKSRVNINFGSATTVKNYLFSNLKSGLTYRGSILLKKQVVTTTGNYNNTIVSFQKGNTVYIIPTKNKVVMPEIKQGYTGFKVVIPVR